MKTAPELVSEVKSKINETSTQELNTLLENGSPLIIDVREPAEYENGHVPTAVNFPRGVLEMKIHSHPLVADKSDAREALKALAEQDIYLVCQSGGRSAFAAESLQRLGFTKVFSVAGGTKDWKDQGFATE